MGYAVGPTPIRVPLTPRAQRDMTERIYRPPTCRDLNGGETCRHSAALGCDLRVVGLTTYRIRG